MRAQSRGAGRISTILFIAILALGFYVAYKFIPVRVRSYAFSDYIAQQVRLPEMQQKPAKLRRLIIEKAQDLRLPLDPGRLAIRERNRNIAVSVSYTVPVECLFWTYTWHFNHHASSRVF